MKIGNTILAFSFRCSCFRCSDLDPWRHLHPGFQENYGVSGLMLKCIYFEIEICYSIVTVKHSSHVLLCTNRKSFPPFGDSHSYQLLPYSPVPSQLLTHYKIITLKHLGKVLIQRTLHPNTGMHRDSRVSINLDSYDFLSIYKFEKIIQY